MRLSEIAAIIADALAVHGDLETREGTVFGGNRPIGQVALHRDSDRGPDGPGLVLWIQQTAPERRRHRHSRACLDDPGPGHGSPTLVCGKIEGLDYD